ncbi:unnamed protein product [Paramecium sonneborni]|uniref:Uncharacterized protein n=1 Tax=Paramecium sonneborni TaxID=65129 RepID=A0A8S1LJQ5_9CILI|nr:unnamed protein product [Paramecium sonneborni]
MHHQMIKFLIIFILQVLSIPGVTFQILELFRTITGES